MTDPGEGIPTSSDLEYDLAHEAAQQPQQHHAAHHPVQVATQTPAYDAGDYGYDLAHEVPGR